MEAAVCLLQKSMSEHWREVLENGQHELQRDFGGVTIVIRKHSVPDAWICQLPNGGNLIGELQDVRRAVERLMSKMQEN
jgi:hypothetical protein